MKSKTKLKVGQITEVVWYDANGMEREKELIHNTHDGRELLCIKHTYGKIIKIFDNAVAILTEETEGFDKYDEVTIIPRGWII